VIQERFKFYVYYLRFTTYTYYRQDLTRPTYLNLKNLPLLELLVRVVSI